MLCLLDPFQDNVTINELIQYVKVKSLICVRLFVTPWTVAHQVPLSMGFPRQEYWSGLQCPPPGDLPDPGIELTSPVTWHRQILYPLSHWRSPRQAEKNGKQWKNKQFGWYQMQFLSSQVGPTLSLCYRSSCVIAFLSPRVPASEQASPVPVFSPCQLHPHSWPATALKERTRRSHFPFLMMHSCYGDRDGLQASRLT